MKKKRKISKKQVQFRRNLNLLLVLAGIIAFVMVKDQLFTIGDYVGTNLFTGKVERYIPVLHEELEKQNLEDYTPVLAAVMQQESKGKGGDPMQASESAGLAPNSITDPEQSIRQGVKHFKQAVEYGEKKNVDMPTIIQAYNMGLGYIDFVASKGGKHEEELAKQYSYIQVQKNPDTYNCGGDKDNFRYPYCYGDFTYTTKVLNNIQTFVSSFEKSTINN
ncbi:hypothetical protein AM500_16885 [Bacillus sp. FJAT-18017]|uniref:lysozyme family protein n=1 Tax=Bacillus sp. FJAT-18017 TaxID=1705566 RepID=UPI0006AEE175|nr:lysozyme family protein [Bacillus sp. FJAT-18017]ALC91281.1 hypothetical protein AM500_16885 [Bacillus sp. FJAT-18017]